MSYLSLPLENLQDHYDLVVVGSGYGGGIAASRLARAGKKVCVLERGRELQPGEYPASEKEAAAEMQVDLPAKHLGPETGLYDFRVNDDINVFLGCGLGGTSLVNANVALRPEPRVFADPAWPYELRQDMAGLNKGFELAEDMLKAVCCPDDQPPPAKQAALHQSASHMAESGNCYSLPIAVTFQDGINHVGIEQKACINCGDCVSGCNHHAKNTTLMNYLPDARNFGAEIFTQTLVQYVEKQGDRWLVYFTPQGAGREKFDAPLLRVSADIVILGAGSLGSTEILMRSSEKGLPLSDQLGLRFTGNGDVLGFGYNNDSRVNGIGFGNNPPQGRDPVGPCITSVIDLREQADLEEGMVIEEGSLPGAIAGILPTTLSAAARAIGRDTDTGIVDSLREKQREIASLLRGPYHGAIRHTQTYLVMSHDDSGGKMALEDDRLRIHWPGVGKQEIFQTINERLRQATSAHGGTYVKNPIWDELFGHNLVTVHPLGGCIMADTGKQGVVNHMGEVFAGPSGTDVHSGLFVCDGAVIPRSVGANPLLTISALAERSCKLLCKQRGWQIDYAQPSVPPLPPGPDHAIGIRFTETMKGYFSITEKDDFERGARIGKEEKSSIEFTLTVTSDDLDNMLKDPRHEAGMFGTVIAPALSPEPLTISHGRFNLFVKDDQEVGLRRMMYSMRLIGRDGRTYTFAGYKKVRDETGPDIWADTTTLFVTIYEGENQGAAVLGKGIMKIMPEDFVRQLTTIEALNAPSTEAKLGAIARFGAFFGGVIFDQYSGIFARRSEFDADAPPRKMRQLRVSPPEIHPFTTEDNKNLLLTRYRGGTKGPVLLSHGLGVSSRIFSIDTIDTNLVEYLHAQGYDVWLLDYRASIELPVANERFSGDEIARYDYPAAVAKVLSVTNAKAVDMVAHCFGSTTFFMAMLGGLQGVRSAVCSQIAMHNIVPAMTTLKTGLHLPSVLDLLGVDSLTAYVDNHADWKERLFDEALRLYPIDREEQCLSKTCHRITFLYAPLYEHDQLNPATHDALHEMFGVANIESFEHLALLCRTGHLVGADGAEKYMPHLDRLALPITFIHGAENDCFLPESTEKSFQLLRETNGRSFYSRHVIGGYGHIDCIFGKNAAKDVFPLILAHLEKAGKL